MSGLEILSIGPLATIQDRGRTGWLRYGVTGGGAMDIYALAEGQALLGNGPDDAALEFAGFGGRFRAKGALTVALSGADMQTTLNGAPLDWRRSQNLQDGDVLTIGAARDGVYGYLHVTGGFQTETLLGARSTHLRAGFGHVPKAGDILHAGRKTDAMAPVGLTRPDYFASGTLRAMWGPQSHYFSAATRAAFAAARFKVTNMRDRMGMQVTPDCGPVLAEGARTIASDAISLGDIQITGDGTPAILLADRGSSGGYPRIGVVISADIGTLAQLPEGAEFDIDFVTREQAVAALAQFRAGLKGLKSQLKPLLRDPRDMADLLAYNLIGGVLRGDEHDEN